MRHANAVPRSKLRTSVDNLVLVEVVDGVKDLLNRLGSVLFGKLSLFANSLEELSAGGELGNNIELVLHREP